MLPEPGGCGGGTVTGHVAGSRGVARLTASARLGASTSRSVRCGSPNFAHSERITAAWWTWRFTIVPAPVYALIAIVGTRTPSRSKKKSISPAGWSFSGVFAPGGRTWSKQPPCSSKVASNIVLSAFEPCVEALAFTAV